MPWLTKKRDSVDITWPSDPANIWCDVVLPKVAGLKDLLKEELPPRIQWNPARKVWLCPVDSVEYIKPLVEGQGLDVVEVGREQWMAATVKVDAPRLHPYQRESVRVIRTRKRMVLAYETGLGKTVTTLAALSGHAQRVLIVCKADMMSEWREHVAEWYSEDATCVQLKRGTEDYMHADVLLISWAVLHKWVGEITTYAPDALVLDELHSGKNRKSERGEAIGKVSRLSSIQYVVGLSATTIDNDPRDGWATLDVVWPKRFGTWWQYVNRYCLVEWNGHGHDIGGLHPLHASELKARLAWCLDRQTKEQQAHLLPTVEVQTITLENKQAVGLKDPTEPLSKRLIRAYIAKYKAHKPTEAVPEVLKIVNKHKHTVVVVYHYDAADQYEAMLKASLPGHMHFTRVDGTLTPKKRKQRIDKAAQQSQSVTLATIGSIAEGLNNLVYADAVVYCEVTFRPLLLLQSLGRFVRISSPHTHVGVYFLRMAGTVDEDVIERVRQKIERINRLIKVGKSEGTVLAGLSGEDDDIPLADMFDNLPETDGEFDLLFSDD